MEPVVTVVDNTDNKTFSISGQVLLLRHKSSLKIMPRPVPMAPTEDGDLFSFLFLFFFAISWATPEAYGASQARGRIGAAAAGLRQSHSNTGSEPHL